MAPPILRLAAVTPIAIFASFCDAMMLFATPADFCCQFRFQNWLSPPIAADYQRRHASPLFSHSDMPNAATLLHFTRRRHFH